MKRFFIFVLGMTIGIYAYSQQTVQVWTEDFDGTVTFATPATNPPGLWVANTLYYYSTGSPVTPKSYHGKVPGGLGVTSVLESPTYDCTNYSYVIVRFDHICKVSPLDKARIEYRTSAGGGWTLWRPLPGGTDTYLGDATNYTKDTCFSAASYAEWQANDSTAFPPSTQTWWKEEIFDLTFEARNTPVQFRFVITHGNTASTQVSYGWLIDNFRLEASVYEVKPPVVEWVSFVEDTAYATGPFEVRAKVATRTAHPIVPSYLLYTATGNNISVSDSVLMTKVVGDSIWKGILPQYPLGTTVSYSFTGMDSVGNFSNSGIKSYVIDKANMPPVTIGTGNTNQSCYTPIGTCEAYAWNRQLYLASEMGTTSKGVTIISLEWQSVNFSATLNNQKCYLQAVDFTSLSVGYIDPVTAGATEVYNGSITFAPGWCKVTFSQPFNLPAGKNLMVHWHNQHGVAVSGDFMRTNATNMSVDAHGNSNNQSSNAGTVTADRANIRLNFLNVLSDNSVSLHAIDIADTVNGSSTTTVPLAVVIKNKGNLNLTLANVNFSINGVQGTPTPPYPSWSGNLSWDMNDTVIIFNYSPTINGYDTIKAWIELPNGQTDAVTYDDTLTKLVFGRGAVVVSFVNSPIDTVYSTGPFEISARITPISGIAGQVTLEVQTLNGGTSSTINVQMTYDANMDLWKATIPQTQYGSDITYSIVVTDILQNVIKTSQKIYLKKYPWRLGGNVIFRGTGVTDDHRDTPLHFYHYHSWSKQLYLESENEADKRGGQITKLAWEYASGTNAFNYDNQRCYMRLIDANETTLPDNPWENYDDPNDVTKGITKVWGPSNYIATAGASVQWVEITLDVPFIWDTGKNLVIYWYNEFSSTSRPYQNYNFRHTQMGVRMVQYTNADTKPISSQKATTKRTDRPNLRLYMEAGAILDASVAMVAIEQPSVGIPISQSVPVLVRITNTGKNNLKNCTIEWSINGVSQTPYPWTGDVPCDFTALANIGNYQPSQLGKYDTITVWVKNPNGTEDEVKNDDTLLVKIMGCLGNLHGNQLVGVGNTFNTITEAMTAIRECGLTGDLTLQLKGTYTENVDLTGLTPYLKGYKLTITSYDNDPDSAIIQPSSGVGIKLENTNDVTIQNITVNTESISTHAVQFTGASKNIVIRDCKLLTNPTTTSQIAPIYKAGSTELVDSIFIIGNTLNGGYFGFYFYGGIGNNTGEYGSNVVFDSNTVTNNYAFGTQVYYTDFLHISHNTLKSRATGTQKWVGMQMQYVNGDLIGNRILQFNPSIDMDGISMKEYNRYLINKKALIANNEVIYQSTSNRGTGVYFNLVNADFLHNSIYLSSGGEVNGLYIETVADNNISIKNNNIVTIGTNGYVIAHYTSTGSTSGYDMDYNNFYSNRNAFIYYNSATLSTLQEIQQNYPTAQHNISLLPDYTDIDVNTALTLNNVQFYVPLLSNVLSDITGKTRTTHATIGAWQILPPTQDMGIIRFVDVTNEVVTNETVTVKVEVQNTGNTPVNTMELGWSINGVVKPNVTYMPQPALTYFNLETVTLGTFVVDTTTNVYEIIVWINSVNQTPEAETVNDTASMFSHRIQLVEWVAPFIEDTTYSLSFDVVARIRTVTGAPTSTPIKLTVANYVKDKYIVYDTLDMNFYDGVWRVQVPEQYHYSKVIFSITVSDTMYNTSTIVDSTFIVPLR
ncbi:MAG: hypothetical protein LBG80_08840, partial [Bacteroidales bacterium]|nr:hypothetical protein [Bacteroidales bacterium]